MLTRKHINWFQRDLRPHPSLLYFLFILILSSTAQVLSLLLLICILMVQVLESI